MWEYGAYLPILLIVAAMGVLTYYHCLERSTKEQKSNYRIMGIILAILLVLVAVCMCPRIETTEVMEGGGEYTPTGDDLASMSMNSDITAISSPADLWK